MDYDINQGDYRIFTSNSLYLIQNLQANKTILIERNPLRMSHTNNEILSRVDIMESYKPHAILGILNIKEIDYILYVKIAKLVGIFNNNEVYTVKEAEVLPITIDSKQDEESSREIENIKSFLKIGFYYSFTYDLTNSIQKQSTYKSNNLYETVEKNNMWNFNLYKEFFTFKIDSCFFVYLIQGYVGILNYTILETNQEFSSMLISRRNWLNPFPGSVSKGINEDGNVANLVETEQLLFFNNIVHSYVFLRGNAPIHYQHSDNNIKIVKSPEQLKPLFMRHIQHIQKDFHFIYFVNMLSAHKLTEQAITTNLEIQFKNNEISNFCKYQYFHLEDTTHSPELENRLEKFTASIEKVLGLFKFFCQDLNYGRVFSEQTGVLRMICFNSLEKTNLVQMKISMKIFEFFINSLTVKVNTKPIFNEKIFNLNFQFLNHPVYHAFKQMWINNGRELEILYGDRRQNILSPFNDIFEYSNTNDSPSFSPNETIEYFLQRNKSFALKMKKIDEVLIYIGTWNVAGLCFNENTQLSDWLFPSSNSKTPDIYLVGFQEIVDLNPKNVMFYSNIDRVEYWKMMVSKNLSKLGSYVMVKELNLVGILLLVFVKDSIKNNINNLTGTIVKTGFMGTLGNKGNCVVRFDINNVSIALSCCHLSSDLNKNDARIKELNDILTRNIQINNIEEQKFRDHNVHFIFGDLNFRIELENSICRQMIKSGKLENLTVYDQFLKARSMNPLFFELDEGPLNFDPTYKYDFNSNEYDTSKKKRVPAWCDRILWRKNKAVELLAYNIANYTYSDHRPVYGLFNVSTQGRTIENKQVSKPKPNLRSSSQNIIPKIESKPPHAHSQSVSPNELKNTNLIDLDFQTKPQIQVSQNTKTNGLDVFDFFRNSNHENPKSTSPYPKIDEIGDFTINPNYIQTENKKLDQHQPQHQQINNKFKTEHNEDFFEFFK